MAERKIRYIDRISVAHSKLMQGERFHPIVPKPLSSYTIFRITNYMITRTQYLSSIQLQRVDHLTSNENNKLFLRLRPRKFSVN
jgi:hypothetical protein